MPYISFLKIELLHCTCQTHSLCVICGLHYGFVFLSSNQSPQTRASLSWKMARTSLWQSLNCLHLGAQHVFLTTSEHRTGNRELGLHTPAATRIQMTGVGEWHCHSEETGWLASKHCKCSVFNQYSNKYTGNHTKPPNLNFDINSIYCIQTTYKKSNVNF